MLMPVLAMFIGDIIIGFHIYQFVIYLTLITIIVNNMPNIKLTKNDCTFVHYVLRMYAQQTPGMDAEDKAEIRDVANKFKL